RSLARPSFPTRRSSDLPTAAARRQQPRRRAPAPAAAIEDRLPSALRHLLLGRGLFPLGLGRVIEARDEARLGGVVALDRLGEIRSEEHTSELQSLRHLV